MSKIDVPFGVQILGTTLAGGNKFFLTHVLMWLMDCSLMIAKCCIYNNIHSLCSTDLSSSFS